jgi:hypothetical protein
LIHSIFVRVSVLVAIVGGLAVGSTAQLANAQSTAATYLVVYKNERLPRHFESRIDQAGGSVAIAYREIGVVTAHSSNPDFERTVEADRRVLGVTLSPVIELGQGSAVLEADPDDNPGSGDYSSTPVSDTDPLAGQQWDMRQIHAPEAHATTRSSVTSTPASTTRTPISRRT